MKIDTAKAVDALHAATNAYWNGRAEPPRINLSASMIGEHCERKPWYSIRAIKKKDGISARLRKLFDVGHREEQIFIKELECSGAKILFEDANSGRQWFLSSAKTSHHFSGSCDGVAFGLPHFPADAPVLLEFKTVSDKLFEALKRHGVQKQYPKYYVQMQSYLGMHRLDKFPEMEWALFCAVNKNTSETYFEFVRFEQNIFDGVEERALRILRSKEAPPRLSENPTYFECKFCDHADICHYQVIPPVSCRSCMHAYPAKDAVWKCGRFAETLSDEKQREGCPDHLFITSLLPFKQVTIAEDYSYVQYEHDGKTFKNAIASLAAPDCFTSAEIATENAANVLTDDIMRMMKEEFPGVKLINGGP